MLNFNSMINRIQKTILSGDCYIVETVIVDLSNVLTRSCNSLPETNLKVENQSICATPKVDDDG